MEALTLDELRSAARAIQPDAVRTPLIKLNVDPAEVSGGAEIWLKLESLQPIGSFKLRGALNALRAADDAGALSQGVWTASAGNMAQGVAFGARQLGVRCTVGAFCLQYIPCCTGLTERIDCVASRMQRCRIMHRLARFRLSEIWVQRFCTLTAPSGSLS
eukprot:COSAG01_NODE_15616_length_1318_cov_1.668033_3_plen_160_part_00